MDLKELRTKDGAALKKELSELYKAGFSLRMQHATQQLSNTNQLARTRKDIARVKTVIREKAGEK